MDGMQLGYSLGPNAIEGFTRGAVGELAEAPGRFGDTPFELRIEGPWRPPVWWRVRTNDYGTIVEYRLLDHDGRIVEDESFVELGCGPDIVSMHVTRTMHIDLMHLPPQSDTAQP